MNHRVILRVFALLVLLGTLGSSSVRAAGILHPQVVADGSRYYRDAVTGTTGLAIRFPAGGQSVLIYNEDTTNALLVQFVRFNVIPTAAELSVPADETWTEVQSIPAGETIVFDVRRSSGMIYDRAAGNGAVTIRLID